MSCTSPSLPKKSDQNTHKNGCPPDSHFSVSKKPRRVSRPQARNNANQITTVLSRDLERRSSEMSALAAFMPQQTIWSLLRRGGVYVGKNTRRPASVRSVRPWRTARARSRPRPVVEKLQRSFSTASAPELCSGALSGIRHRKNNALGRRLRAKVFSDQKPPPLPCEQGGGFVWTCLVQAYAVT